MRIRWIVEPGRVRLGGKRGGVEPGGAPLGKGRGEWMRGVVDHDSEGKVLRGKEGERKGKVDGYKRGGIIGNIIDMWMVGKRTRAV